MSQQMDRETLLCILQAEDVETLPFPVLVHMFQQEEGISDHLPDGVCQIDPRNGDRVLFSASRALRPHDNLSALQNDANVSLPCIVCEGKTTGVVDVAELSEGFTFINKNLYPSLYPLEVDQLNLPAGPMRQDSASGRTPYGLHFLQWTSSLHGKDWHNMPLEDRVVVMRRLAALEKKLLADAKQFLPPFEPRGDLNGAQGFVLIVKNYGHLVGGSLIHGHQQIVLSNVMPGRMWDDWRFEKERGIRFSAYLLLENPPELLIRDYGSAVLVVPYFMRRPYDMMLLVKDVSRGYLHQLNKVEIEAIAEGWHDALRAIRWIMPQIHRDIAYNVITHNGPGTGLYFEFLPYTQEYGGFEHLGLLVCQGNPRSAAMRISEYLEQ